MTEHETRRMRLQADLDAQKTQAERNRLGQFATPPALAAELVTAAVAMLPKRSCIHFLDPGFGTGSFYSALLRSVAKSRIKSARGFEIDPHYGDHAKALWHDLGLDMDIADFTAQQPEPRYNLVICNPPYVRHHHLHQAQKQTLRDAVSRHTGIDMNGLSGLYCYFLVLSKLWMRDDGVAAWLIPSEFMDVNYGRRVKEFLLEHVRLERIHRFDPHDGQFDDALVSSAVVFFRNGKPNGTEAIEFSFGGSVLSPKLSNRVAPDELRHSAKWTALPRKRIEMRSSAVPTLGDFFNIKRGLATGCNSFFVLSESEAAALRLPRQFLQPILPSPRDLESDEINADPDGMPRLQKRRLLLSCDLPEDEVRRSYPSLWDYLDSGVGREIRERYLCKHREPWYSQEKRPAAPFLLTYMGHPSSKSKAPFRFILNRSEATAANVYLMLYPKPFLAVRLKEKPQLLGRLWNGLLSITAETFVDEGRVYGGALYKIEPSELMNVPAALVLDAVGQTLPRQQALFA